MAEAPQAGSRPLVGQKDGVFPGWIAEQQDRHREQFLNLETTDVENRRPSTEWKP